MKDLFPDPPKPSERFGCFIVMLITGGLWYLVYLVIRSFWV